MDLLSIIFAIIASISTFIACLYGLHRLWLQPHHSEIPVETGQYLTDSPRKKMSPDELIRVKSLPELLEVYIPLILKLDSRYWIHNIGLDGYTYLYFQRELIKMLLVYGIVSFIIMIPVSIWFAGVKLPTSLDEPIPESDSDYTRYYEQLYAIIITIMSYFFSLYAIYTLFEIRDHIKSQLIDQNFATTKRHDYDALKARSVHIRGLFPEDRKGEMLCSGVEKFLEASGGGKIVSTMVVPDFVRIIELEGDRKRVDNAYKLLLANEPAVRRIFFPKKYRQEAYYEKKLNSIEDKIEQELMKPVTCSGHAFMCFDSIKTRDHCLEYFKENEYKTWKDLLDKVANQDALVPKKSMLKRKFTSTFQKFDDKDLLESLQDQELKVVMDRLERPFDIFWSNMGGSRDRRILIKLFAFLALIFLSTPAALFSVIQKVPGLNYLDFSQYIPATEFGTFLKQLSLPVWIIILNQLLLFLIDFSAYEEKHHSFTLCQISIFSKSLFYLMFNMFLIPALTLVTSGEKANVSHFTSLFTLFYGVIFEGSSLADILRQLYTSTAGNFFIIFLFQNAGFSSGFGLLRIGEIVGAFGSTWLAHYQRTCMNDMDRWRKREIDVFKYGFLCAQIVVALAVVVSYTATTPGIILAGLAFLLMRYSVDGFNLLTVYKMEIDSDGRMIQSILKYAAMACLLHQFAMGVSYYYEGFMIPCILIAILILVTIFLSYQISKPITADEKDLFDMSQEIMRANIKDTREDIHKWETAYRHPLLVSPEEGSRGEREISVSRGSRTLSHVTVR